MPGTVPRFPKLGEQHDEKTLDHAVRDIGLSATLERPGRSGGKVRGPGVAPPNLTLLENVQVEIGKGRPFSPSADRYKSDADVNSPVYPIRGSYDMYICSPPVAPFRVIGNNCSVFGYSQATGACYRTTFGDWSCSMAPIGGTSQRDNVAAPK